jgi:glutamyl-tRNA reductase
MIHMHFNHRNTSLIDREKELNSFSVLSSMPGVLLQTCNRMEFYEGNGEIPVEIARHLFRVVSGLESHLVGEIAIQGQVKSAYIEASGKYRLSKSLHQLFQTALFVGKRVRTSSGISKGAVSHSQAATEIIARSGLLLKNAIISLIGAHKLNLDIIRFLTSKGAETIFLANKNYDKAKEIGDTMNCQVMRLDQLKEMLQFTDILISATAAPHLIVKYDDFPQDKQMLIIDLAFPRDVDERIGELQGITLFNLESIEAFVQQNIDTRHSRIEQAEQIIEEEIQKFTLKQQQDATRHFTIG